MSIEEAWHHWKRLLKKAQGNVHGSFSWIRGVVQTRWKLGGRGGWNSEVVWGNENLISILMWYRNNQYNSRDDKDKQLEVSGIFGWMIPCATFG
jgi:hypothetical protein